MINIEILGQGEPVLFLHGWGHSLEDFSFLRGKRLNFQSVLVDLPGFGKSPHQEALVSVDDYAKAIAQELDLRQVTPRVIVGHSFGGKVALALSVHFPKANLILLAPSLLKPRFSLKRWWRVRIYKLKRRLGGDVSKYGSRDYQQALPHMRRVLIDHLRHDAKRKIKSCPAKVLIINGTNDLDTPLYLARKCKRLFRRCQLIKVPGGHMSPLLHCYLLIREVQSLL